MPVIIRIAWPHMEGFSPSLSIAPCTSVRPISQSPMLGRQGRRHPRCQVRQQGCCLQAGLISKEDIIIDAKSGVSGAGRSAKQNLLYTEIAEGLNCYGVTRHRHMPEIEQVGDAVEWLPAARSSLVSGAGPLCST